jgi:hypothetical protein
MTKQAFIETFLVFQWGYIIYDGAGGERLTRHLGSSKQAAIARIIRCVEITLSLPFQSILRIPLGKDPRLENMDACSLFLQEGQAPNRTR